MWFRRITSTILMATMVSVVKAEVWTDSTGRFAVKAEFVSLQFDAPNHQPIVKLKRDDGREIRVPLNKLSQVSQQRANQLTAKANENLPTDIDQTASSIEAENRRIAAGTLEWMSVHLLDDWQGPASMNCRTS